MSNLPATLSYQQAMMPVDPGAIAAAESAKARIQSAYVMAMQKPRNEMQSRSRILEACKRPEFAGRVEYAKPVGGKQKVGPSIRFAELAVREWGNVITETQLIYEDDRVRRIKVTVIDLETNATFGKEIQVNKTVERKDKKGREVVAERINSYGDPVFVVVATEEEMYAKEAALISKIIRNEGLRLIPSDIVDEAIDVARATIRDRDAKDPKAALKKILDSFTTIGLKPKHIEEYIGHGIETISPAELQDLRGVYQAISSGEATWADYVAKAEARQGDLNDLLKKPEPPKPIVQPQVAPVEPEVMKPEPEKKRLSPEELDGMRCDLAEEIAREGLSLDVIEKTVKAFSNQWTVAHMDKIRGMIIPNLKAELMGA